MTIAAGFHCTDGIILFADTCMILQDGSKRQGRKLDYVFNRHGFCGIVHAADDGNASKTLVDNILKDIRIREYTSYEEVEAAITAQMTTWALAHYQLPPTGMVFAANFYAEPRLYLCEPPNTIVVKFPYCAAGTGARVTDPLAEMLIENIVASPRERLWHIAYLVYRAKKDDANCCGHTDAMFFPRKGTARMISRKAMQDAEAFGPTLDLYLSRAFTNLLSAQTKDDLKRFHENLAELMKPNIHFLAEHEFPPVVPRFDSE